MITPNTVIKFLQVPFSSSQNNLLKFSSLGTQENYMFDKVQYSFSGCTYQREGNGEFVRINKNMDSLYTCNYVMFQNSNFGDKWFYAFIEHLEYVSPNVTRVYLKMDVWQTFQFDFTLQKSFVDRQHFITDSYNTLVDTPSGGELKVVQEEYFMLKGAFFIFFNSDPTRDDAESSPLFYPEIDEYSLPVYMCWCNSATQMAEIVQAVSNKGRADRIQACFYTPHFGTLSSIVPMSMPKGDLTITEDSLTLVSNFQSSAQQDDLTINLNFTPVYKKELCYPYAKLEVVDSITGKSIELDLSKFDNPMSPTFRIMGSFQEIPEYKVVPRNYNGSVHAIENALVVNPNTEMPVFSNTYAKYLKDNTTSQSINAVMSGVGAIGSISTGNVAGAIGSFANLASIVSADSVASTQPNKVSGINGDASEYLNYNGRIYFRIKTMDTNHMNIARNFWNQFGYPIRKIDNVNPFVNKYNFIKTADCNIVANSIPSEYQRELEQIFNKGVTVWTSNYLDYDLI